MKIDNEHWELLKEQSLKQHEAMEYWFSKYARETNPNVYTILIQTTNKNIIDIKEWLRYNTKHFYIVRVFLGYCEIDFMNNKEAMKFKLAWL